MTYNRIDQVILQFATLVALINYKYINNSNFILFIYELSIDYTHKYMAKQLSGCTNLVSF